MEKTPNIPTEEEFAIAKQNMRNRLAKEAEIRESILSSIPSAIPCHDVWVWLSGSNLTISFVYPNNTDLEAHENNGTKTKVNESIEQTLNLSEFKEFVIEYHSHQHVLEKFNGNYDKYFS